MIDSPHPNRFVIIALPRKRDADDRRTDAQRAADDLWWADHAIKERLQTDLGWRRCRELQQTIEHPRAFRWWRRLCRIWGIGRCDYNTLLTQAKMRFREDEAKRLEAEASLAGEHLP